MAMILATVPFEGHACLRHAIALFQELSKATHTHPSGPKTENKCPLEKINWLVFFSIWTALGGYGYRFFVGSFKFSF